MSGPVLVTPAQQTVSIPTVVNVVMFPLTGVEQPTAVPEVIVQAVVRGSVW